MREETLTDVPADDLGSVVGGYAQDGATKIKCRRNGNGTWTVTATFA